MKIALVSPFPEQNISTRRLVYFAKNLNDDGHIAQVCPPAQLGQLRQRWDILHVLKPHYRSAIPALLLKRRARTVLDIDDWDPQILEDRGRKFEAKISRFLEKLLSNKFDGVIAGNEIAKKYAIEDLGVKESRVLAVIHNGVDPSRFNPDIDGSGVRKKLGLGKFKVVTYVGTLASFEQISPILRGFKAIEGEYHDARLMVVGDGIIKQKLMELSKELGIGNDVIFIGAVPHDAVPTYMAASDILINIPFNPPSARYANPGMKGFEYMAMGKPIIAASCGCAPDIFEHGKAAYLIDSPEPDEVKKAYASIVGNKREARKRAARARELAVTKYDWLVLTKQLEAAYEKLLS